MNNTTCRNTQCRNDPRSYTLGCTSCCHIQHIISRSDIEHQTGKGENQKIIYSYHINGFRSANKTFFSYKALPTIAPLQPASLNRNRSSTDETPPLATRSIEGCRFRIFL